MKKSNAMYSVGVEEAGAAGEFGIYVSHLGRRIAGTRTLKRMTQEECAKSAGISRAALAKLEAGQGDPKLSTLLALAGALSIPLTEFICALQPELWEKASENGSSLVEAAGLGKSANVVGASDAGIMAAKAGSTGASLGNISGGAATTSGMAAIGGVVGGGMATGAILNAAAPVTIVGAIAYGLFKLFDEN